MTTLFDTRFGALGKRMVDKFGTDMTVIIDDDSFNEVTNERTPGAEDGFTYVIKCSPPRAYRVNEIDDQHILIDDMEVIVARDQGNLMVSETRVDTSGDVREGTSGDDRVVDVPSAQSAYFSPRKSHENVLVAGISYRVITLRPIYSGDEIAVWKIQLRS